MDEYAVDHNKCLKFEMPKVPKVMVRLRRYISNILVWQFLLILKTINRWFGFSILFSRLFSKQRQNWVFPLLAAELQTTLWNPLGGVKVKSAPDGLGSLTLGTLHFRHFRHLLLSTHTRSFFCAGPRGLLRFRPCRLSWLPRPLPSWRRRSRPSAC